MVNIFRFPIQSMFWNETLRQIIRQVSHMVVFPSPRFRENIRQLSRQLFSDINFLTYCLTDIAKTRYTYMLLDLRANCPEHLRVRSGFPPECIVYTNSVY